MMSDSGPSMPRRTELLGVPVDCLTMTAALEWAEWQLTRGSVPKAVIAVNPEKVMKAWSNPVLGTQLAQAGLLLPDGIGVVMAARLLGIGRFERVPGSEFMPHLCALAAKHGARIFLFGAKPEVVEGVKDRLLHDHPGLAIVGTQHGFLAEAEMPRLIEQINRAKPDVLFLALGSPRQEQWMARYLPQVHVKICQGVGGTFDVLAGVVKRAPSAWRTLHLEWFYRL
ncbi:MAG: WecB/TagA/CpsF family glycosyltransferase, partial [Nitrospira sp.]